MKILNHFFSRFYRTSAKKDLQLPKNLFNILVGLMLGDAHAERGSRRRNTRFQFTQSLKHLVYIQHLYELFKEYVGSIPKTLTVSGGLPHMVGKTYGAVRFNTLSLPCFNVFRVLFYNREGVKVLPVNLFDLLTVEGLAYWYMDDGYNHKPYFMFCTERYTYEENQQLVLIFKQKFGLNASVKKYSGRKGYRLRVARSSREDFVKLVKPHVLPLFYYKLGIDE